MTPQRSLDMEFSIESDQVDESKWSDTIDLFADASIYQTWAHGAIRWGEENISHLLLKQGNAVVAASQVQIKKIPLFGFSIADVPMGPLWRLKDKEKKIDVYRQMLRALHLEYVIKRKMFLRIRSEEYFEDILTLNIIFKEEGYNSLSTDDQEQTLIIDVRESLEKIRKQTKYRWRRHLNKAEKGVQALRIEKDAQILRDLKPLFLEMCQRKRVLDQGDFDCYCEIQERLPDRHKMKICICEVEDKVVGCNVWSNIGERGILIFRINGNMALKNRSAYLLSWEQIKDTKNSGMSYYDEGRYEEVDAPTDAFYKRGMGGRVISILPHHVACDSFWKRTITCFAFRFREVIRSIHKRLKRLESRIESTDD